MAKGKTKSGAQGGGGVPKLGPHQSRDVPPANEPRPLVVEAAKPTSPDITPRDTNRYADAWGKQLKKLEKNLEAVKRVAVDERDPERLRALRLTYGAFAADLFDTLRRHNLLETFEAEEVIKASAPRQLLAIWDRLSTFWETASTLPGWESAADDADGNAASADADVGAKERTTDSSMSAAPATVQDGISPSMPTSDSVSASSKGAALKEGGAAVLPVDKTETVLEHESESVFTEAQIRAKAHEYYELATRVREHIGTILDMHTDTLLERFAAREAIQQLEELIEQFRSDWREHAAPYLPQGGVWTPEWKRAVKEYDDARKDFQHVKRMNKSLRRESEQDWRVYERDFYAQLAVFSTRIVLAQQYDADRRSSELTGLRSYLDELRDHWWVLKAQLWADDPEVKAIHHFDSLLRKMRTQLERMMRETNTRPLDAEQMRDALAEAIVRTPGCWNDATSLDDRYQFLVRYVRGLVKDGEDEFVSFVDNPGVFSVLVTPLIAANERVQPEARVEEEIAVGVVESQDPSIPKGSQAPTVSDAEVATVNAAEPDPGVPVDSVPAMVEPRLSTEPRQPIVETERVRTIARVLADDLFWEPSVTRAVRVTRIGAMLRRVGGTRLASDVGLRPDRIDAFYDAAGFADEQDLAMRMDVIRARFASVDTAGAEPVESTTEVSHAGGPEPEVGTDPALKRDPEPAVVSVEVDDVPDEPAVRSEAPTQEHPEQKVAGWARRAMDAVRRWVGGDTKMEEFREPVDTAPVEPVEARTRTLQGVLRTLTPVLGSKIFVDALQYLSSSFVADRTRSQLSADLMRALDGEKEVIRNGADDEARTKASMQALERVSRVIAALDEERVSVTKKEILFQSVTDLRTQYLAPTEENRVAQCRELAELLERHIRATAEEWREGSAPMRALEVVARMPFAAGIAYGVTQFRERFEGSLANDPDATRVAHVAVAFREAWNAERAARKHGEAMNPADAVSVLSASYGVKAVTSPLARLMAVLRRADAGDLDEAAGLLARAREQLHAFIDKVLGPAEKKAGKTASAK